MAAGNDILTVQNAEISSQFAHLMPPLEDASVLTVACRPDDFSASQLARAVEDSDAHLINLNVTDLRLDDGRITVELRTNHRNCESTARSLERYGYEVIGVDGLRNNLPDFGSSSTLRARANELLHILNL